MRGGENCLFSFYPYVKSRPRTMSAWRVDSSLIFALNNNVPESRASSSILVVRIIIIKELYK